MTLSAIDRIRAVLNLDRPLRILTLFDPDAELCSQLRESEWDVSCCPDLQRGWGTCGAHEDVIVKTTEELVEVDETWDVVIGTRGLDRYLSSHSYGQTNVLFDWIRDHSTVTILEGPQDPIAPDLNRQGPYRVHELVGRFYFFCEIATCANDRGEYYPPLIAASNHYLISSSFSARREQVTEAFWEEPPSSHNNRVRTYLLSDDSLVKVEAVSQEYFERSQIAGEANFLRQVDEVQRKALQLPRLVVLDSGVSVMTMMREGISGVTITELPSLEAELIIREILGEASRFAHEGLYPNDLRPWNVLWSGTRCAFIDFADTSAFDEDVNGFPQIVALAATMTSVIHPSLFRRETFVASLSQWEPVWRNESIEELAESWSRLPSVSHDLNVCRGLSEESLFTSLLQQIMTPAKGTSSRER